EIPLSGGGPHFDGGFLAPHGRGQGGGLIAGSGDFQLAGFRYERIRGGEDLVIEALLPTAGSEEGPESFWIGQGQDAELPHVRVNVQALTKENPRTHAGPRVVRFKKDCQIRS